MIEKDHEIYQRRGTDLIMRKKISLQEALCGFNMNIKTLQKEARFVPITTEPGQVIQDKMLYRIPNEGKCSKITEAQWYIFEIPHNAIP